jgi:hypothetical protein
MPVRDRNGETIAVARIQMETFFGQTENNLLTRSLNIIKRLQLRITSAKDLTD